MQAAETLFPAQPFFGLCVFRNKGPDGKFYEDAFDPGDPARVHGGGILLLSRFAQNVTELRAKRN